MPIPTDVKTSTAAAVELTPEQIRQENADAAAASGYTDPQRPGESDNIQDASQPDEATRKQSAAETVRAQHQQQADDREDLMASIAARRRAHMSEGQEDMDAYGEIVDNADETQQNHVQDGETEVAQEAQAAQEAQTPPEHSPRFFTNEAGQEVVELLVNGKVTVVPAARVLAAAQKLEAGDERLRQAAQERQRLDAERQEFERQKLAQQQIPQPSATDADPDLKAKLREGFSRLQDGDEQAVDELVQTLAQGRQPTTPQIDTAQLANEVAIQQNRTAWSNNLLSDEQAYMADPSFADITGNPLLAERAAAVAKQICAESKPWDTGARPRDIMNRAAEYVRNEARQMAEAAGYVQPQQQVAPQPNGRADATAARKAQAGSTVVSSEAQRPLTPKPVAQDGGRSPSSMDSKLAAFAGLQGARTNPAIKR